MSSYKIVIIGDEHSGKSSGLRKFVNYEYEEKRYRPTLGCDVWQTNHLGKVLNFWDVGGNPIYSPLSDGYYIGASLVVIVSDKPDVWIEKYLKGCDNTATRDNFLVYPKYGISDKFLDDIVERL